MGVPVTHILTLSGRSLQSQPFHRESFYVTGTPPRHTSLVGHSLRHSRLTPFGEGKEKEPKGPTTEPNERK